MKRRLLKVAITTALATAIAVPAFANPFSDVPAKHWAYDAVNKLAKAGIIDGFNDGTFRGEKTVNRYEMAQVISKAMNKTMNADQKALVEKLAREYASEMKDLGIRVDGVQSQVDDMVKFSGDARIRYYNADNTGVGTGGNAEEYRFRLGATAKVNDDITLYGRITSASQSFNTTTTTANVEAAVAKTHIWGMDTAIGRQDIVLGQGMLAGDGLALLDGVSVKHGNLKAFAGKESDGTNMVKSYGGQYDFKLGLPVSASYLALGANHYYAVGTGFDLLGSKVTGEYAKNTAGAKGYQVKAALGQSGLSVGYKDIEQGAVPYESGINWKATNVPALSDIYAGSTLGHVKGMEYEYNKDLAKNTNLNVVYQSIKDGGKNIRGTVNVKF